MEEVLVVLFLLKLGWAGVGDLTKVVHDPADLTWQLFSYCKHKGFMMGQSADELGELAGCLKQKFLESLSSAQKGNLWVDMGPKTKLCLLCQLISHAAQRLPAGAWPGKV